MNSCEKQVTEVEKRGSELNARSIIGGIVIGFVALSMTIYLMTYVGMSASVSPISAFMGIIILPLFSKSVSKLEINMVQTIASAVEAGAFAMVTSIAAITLLEYDLNPLVTILILLISSVIGVSFISIFRRGLCEDPNLSFPTAVACEIVVKKVENPPKRDMRMFLIFTLIGLALSVCSNILGIIPSSIDISKYLPNGCYMDIAFMPILLGFGYIAGYKIGIVLIIAGVFANLILAPIGTSLGWYPSPAEDFGVMQQFNLSPMIGMAVAGGIFPVLKNWKVLAKGLKSFKNKFSANKSAAESIADKTEKNRVLYIILLASIAAAIVLYKVCFNISPILVFVTILAAMLLTFVSIKVTAETGISVNGIMDMLIIFVIASILGDPVLGLLVLSMTTTISCMSIDMIIDYKTGQLVGGNPKKQFIGQCIGLIPGVIMAVLVTNAIMSVNGVGTPEAPFPYASIMNGLASSAVGGAGTALNFSNMGIGGIVGIILSAFGLPATAMSLALYLTPGFLIVFGIGGIIRKIVEKKKGKETAQLLENAASGLVVGDALIAVLTIILTVVSAG